MLVQITRSFIFQFSQNFSDMNENSNADWHLQFHIMHTQGQSINKKRHFVYSKFDLWSIGISCTLCGTWKESVANALQGRGVDWDDPIPDPLRAQWEEWRSELPLLEKIEVPRCFKPDDFQDVNSVGLHYFSDASTEAYGQCTYIRCMYW